MCVANNVDNVAKNAVQNVANVVNVAFVVTSNSEQQFATVHNRTPQQDTTTGHNIATFQTFQTTFCATFFASSTKLLTTRMQCHQTTHAATAITQKL
jgi:stress response protein SCP2